MKVGKQGYQFETIQDLGTHTPGYYGLDRTSRKFAPPQSNYLQNARTLDYLNQAHGLQIHRACDNDFIQTHVPDLNLTDQKTLLRKRVSSHHSQSPLREYTKSISPIPYESPIRYDSHIRHSSPIRYDSLNRYHSPIQSRSLYENPNLLPYQLRNPDGLSLYYYRSGDIPIQSQLVSSHTVTTHTYHNHYPRFAPHTHYGIDGHPVSMDVYSQKNLDQCNYCLKDPRLISKNTDYYNRDWNIEKERLSNEIQKKFQIYNYDPKYKQTEIKKDYNQEFKNLKSNQDPISIQEEVETEKSNDNNQKSDEKKNTNLGGFKQFLFVNKFGKTLLKGAQQNIFDRNLDDYNLTAEQYEQFYKEYEDLQNIDLDHLTEEEKLQYLKQYEYINKLNEEMKKDQITSQQQISGIYKFVENQMNGMNEQISVLDDLAERVKQSKNF